ncbi:hypothetical protein BDA99DRAFT_521756 [Phascolomyces articulosus]|uniref:Malic enzyme n=1 Tax=Phascolomyces articulosus TaxID=60185 RepID=A0AAD5JRP3_9FUNG|nr:hypothetical protein BDA99DRAFT_521756 [Phascolomyces articulosus]
MFNTDNSNGNEGTAMSLSERKALHLTGRLPSVVEDINTQKKRVLQYLRSKPSMLEKYILMARLRTTHMRLFYKIVIEELQELAPIIYTPTVGTACMEYSNIYPFLTPPGVPDGLFLSGTDDFETLCDTIRSYDPSSAFSPEIAVISDGSRILGLGDLGVGGMGIPIGKLQLYVAGAGIDPRRTLPVIVDLGTNNERLRTDPYYLGQRKARPADKEFYESVDRVLKALKTVYPNLLIQFEDWSSEHAFGLLEKYQNQLLCFNDDIQGTGAVILSGMINAIALAHTESGVSPDSHRIIFYGAGSAAIGVARQIQSYFQIDCGMTEEEARRLFWIVDSKGLVTSDRGDKLPQHKVYYARNDNNGKQYKNLMDIVNYIQPTALIGLSSTSGAFTTDVLKRMAELNARPIVFPLSNPATKAECTFADAMQATDNRVIFASGTAFPAYTIAETQKTMVPAQGNNMYIFPGLGLGAVLAQPKTISDVMIYKAAKALADSLSPQERKQGLLYPELDRIRDVSAIVAEAVCREAIDQGTASSDIQNAFNKGHLLGYIEERMWSPESKLIKNKI